MSKECVTHHNACDCRHNDCGRLVDALFHMVWTGNRTNVRSLEEEAKRLGFSVTISSAYNADVKSSDATISAFDQFWKAYPRKQAKKAAFKAWKNAKDKPNIERILSVLDSQKRSDSWTKDNGSYIPMPSTWLNQGRWDDEVITIEKEDYTTGAV